MTTDGRHDFDFLFGSWLVGNRKLQDPLSPEPTPWLEFEAAVESRPILAGLGNCDTYHVRDFAGRGETHAFALRLFDPETRLWRIWWASTGGGGQLDTPVVGRFEAGEGLFEADDVLEGRQVRVRFVWTAITPSSARWQQSFSFDGGETFEDNWIMDWRRTG